MKKFITAGLMMMMAAGAFAQSNVVNPYPKTINVNGSAEMEIVPDEIYVVVDLKEYEKKGSGKQDLEKIKAAFLANAKKVGIPESDISIASYEGFNPNLWLRKKKKKDELYASIAYQVKFSNSKKIDELIEVLDDEATENFQVVKTSHSKIKEFRQQLKVQALISAKEKAKYLAAAIDEQVGAAITITEPNDMYVSDPVAQYQYKAVASNYAVESKMGGDNVFIDFKKIKLRFDVNAIFALK